MPKKGVNRFSRLDDKDQKALELGRAEVPLVQKILAEQTLVNASLSCALCEEMGIDKSLLKEANKHATNESSRSAPPMRKKSIVWLPCKVCMATPQPIHPVEAPRAKSPKIEAVSDGPSGPQMWSSAIATSHKS
ncbi:uncharacterized protein LOC113463522 [Phoenix dactylifera]|uniref:Uncharacterized protein LOC113463522 n=1 Tax=Phoenix dactylifera TaxID=42345 RepID=A0A8B8JBG6_PHODC|nr:uncharacterized protein LOC113463522 [Phoenix dactylifera]